ncbi:hypothetical protein BGZ95_000334 [Linnemannia exigua]|uniref:Spindle pole body component n=1 Tax=Linnemannia exigua TaxID=604196 RepID=A0AAD4D8E7_9FUNG|nr:hypothetical protein BGZ95_000334 [Linnemannia exigua]
MQDRDPASLLFIPRDEYGPLLLDPELFESVGDGVSQKTFAIPKAPSPKTTMSSSATDADPLDRLKSLAAKMNPLDAGELDSINGLGEGEKWSTRKRMGTAQSWNSAWEQDLDQRVHDINRYNIFDSFRNPGTVGVFDSQDAQLSSTLSAQGSRVLEADPNLDTERRRPTFVETISHSAGPTSFPSTTKDTLSLSFDLPSLTKRPRNILDDCLLRDQVPRAAGTSHRRQQQPMQDIRARKVAKSQSFKGKTDEQKEARAEAWRAAGKPDQDDLTGSHGRPTGRKGLIQEQLSWETCATRGPRTVPSHSVMSPYVTEAGIATFESVYLRLLEGMMNAGTHMRRLVSVADTCINHPEGMGLIRIAFGRSLSSYLTFLQGTVVSLQESCRDKQIQLLELCHKTHDLEEMLSRLAHLCQCHVSQEDDSKAGFYLPPGPDLLSMIYIEILEQPSPSDPLWVALLLSMLDQASKPYRDILSRWMGITPSARGAHQKSQLSNFSSAEISSSGLGLLDFAGHLATTASTVDTSNSRSTNRNGEAFSIFDSYLQQSLQGLDPFGEFFVHSKRGWTWDGSELIVLSDPLEYNGEFRMSDTVPSVRFLDDRLAERVMEAGKELQILVEFEPRHPLIAHDRNFPMKTNWLKWFYVQEDAVKHRNECAKARTEVLQAIGTRLESMGWIPKKSTLGRQTGKQVAADSVQESRSVQGSGLLMDLDTRTFERLPGQGSTTTELGNSISLDLGLNPDLLGFFSFSSTLGQTKDMALACPDMMSFLLEPTTMVSTVAANEGLMLPPSGTATERKQIRLEGLAPLTVLAEQSLCYTIRARASLINTCVMSLYIHDLNLLGHLEIMERFLLMRDGWFVARLGEALFEDETGLLMRSAEASNEAAANETADSATRPGVRNDRRSSVASTSSSTSSWRKARLTWPPRSGEVEMTLRAVLLDCFQADETDEVERSRVVEGLDVSDMEVEDDGTPFQSFVRGAKKDRSLKRKKISAEELEETLAFAVKGYDEESTICRDANALEALDFLYLDYKAPRPLRLLVFTSSAFEKYTRLFTFQLRLARVGAAMKQIYRHVRTRQKLIAASFPAPPPLSQNQLPRPQDTVALSRVQQARQQLQMEMKMLHRFRFEAQQIFDGLQGFIVHVAMGQTWETFMERMRDIQRRVEDWIILGSSQGEESTMGGGEGNHEEEEESVFDELVGDLTSLREEHDRVLDHMLLRSLLKRKQAPILKIVHGILNCLLRFFQMVTRLQSSSSNDIAFLGSDGGDNAEEDEEAEVALEDILERQRVRIEKLQSLQDKFRGSCRMLVKVLKVLDERGVGVETGGGTSKGIADASSANGSSGGFLPQLLLRLDMSGFNDN